MDNLSDLWYEDWDDEFSPRHAAEEDPGLLHMGLQDAFNQAAELHGHDNPQWGNLEAGLAPDLQQHFMWMGHGGPGREHLHDYKNYYTRKGLTLTQGPQGVQAVHPNTGEPIPMDQALRHAYSDWDILGPHAQEGEPDPLSSMWQLIGPHDVDDSRTAKTAGPIQKIKNLWAPPIPEAQSPQEAAQGRMCAFHPDRPAVAAEGFAPMCDQCYGYYQEAQKHVQQRGPSVGPGQQRQAANVLACPTCGSTQEPYQVGFKENGSPAWFQCKDCGTLDSTDSWYQGSQYHYPNFNNHDEWKRPQLFDDKKFKGRPARMEVHQVEPEEDEDGEYLGGGPQYGHHSDDYPFHYMPDKNALLIGPHGWYHLDMFDHSPYADMTHRYLEMTGKPEFGYSGRVDDNGKVIWYGNPERHPDGNKEAVHQQLAQHLHLPDVYEKSNDDDLENASW